MISHMCFPRQIIDIEKRQCILYIYDQINHYIVIVMLPSVVLPCVLLDKQVVDVMF